MSNKEKVVQYKIVEIRKKSHFENDFYQYGLTPDDVKSGKMNISLNLTFNQDKETIDYSIKILCFINDQKHPLFGIESVYTFAIMDMNTEFRKEESREYEFPEGLIITLAQIAISGTRGMLAVLNTTPEYRNIYLPVVHADKLLADIYPNSD